MNLMSVENTKKSDIKSKKTSYKDSGVDIELGNSFVKRISNVVSQTKRIGSDSKIGGFGGVFDLAKCNFEDPILVAANDGVGTKLKIAIETNMHSGVGIDLVAMCVNDLIVQGAEPLFFLDYYSTGKLNSDVAYEIISSIATGCKISGCALIGGETAEMPGLYANKDYDLAGFAVGAVERNKILPSKDISPGDLILGISSSGFHSNGFSLIRKVLDDNSISFEYKPNFGSGRSVAEILLEPTKIYVDPVLRIVKKGYVKALAHITGGGLTENIPRVLANNICAEIDCSSWAVPDVFQWIQNIGNIESKEMLSTFNNGIGMVIIAEEKNLSSITKELEACGEKVSTIGVLKDSKFEESYVEYKNANSYL